MGLKHITFEGSHKELGLEIGKGFSKEIHESLDNYDPLVENFLPKYKTDEGKNLYEQYLKFNNNRFPNFVDELKGISEGSNRPFQEIFMCNIRSEFGCSNSILLDEKHALLGHNEDGNIAFKNSFLVTSKVDDGIRWTAYTYPGFLCGNAFGFNEYGLVFAVNNVAPKNKRIGIGRHFIARSLLESKSIDEAVQKCLIDSRASGFACAIGSIKERRVIVLELGPDNHYLREVNGPYFHANHYLDMGIEQTISKSSERRVLAAKKHNVRDKRSLLESLSDTSDADFPIYQTAKGNSRIVTLCTALFDLDKKELVIYHSNPKNEPADKEIFQLYL